MWHENYLFGPHTGHEGDPTPKPQCIDLGGCSLLSQPPSHTNPWTGYVAAAHSFSSLGSPEIAVRQKPLLALQHQASCTRLPTDLCKLSRLGTDSSNAHGSPFTTDSQDIKSMGTGSPDSKGMGTGSPLCSSSFFPP